MPFVTRHASPSGSAVMPMDAGMAGRHNTGGGSGHIRPSHGSHRSLSAIPRGPKSHDNISGPLTLAAAAARRVAAEWERSLPPDVRASIPRPIR